MLCGAGLAQTDPVRVERFPDGKPFGPYKGAVRFTVGRGAKRPLRGAKIVFRLVQGEGAVFEKPIVEVPSDVILDTTPLAPGEYRVRLVRVDGEIEETLDEFVVEVGEAPKKPAPTPPPVVEPEPPVASLPLRFVTRATDATRPPVSGVLRVPVSGLAALGEGYFPAVEVWQGGKLLARNGEIIQKPNAFIWDTRNAPDGEYTLKLVALDLSSDRQSECDSLRLIVKNPRKALAAPTGAPAPTGITIPPPPNWKGGRSGPGLTLSGTDATLVGSNADKFNLIVTLSRLAGDPHPQVAGAQWALESAWGKTPSGKNNYFGIKAQPSESGTTKNTTEFYDGVPTGEVARFADYNSVFECLQARLKFLRKVRYSSYWKAKTAEEACFSLQNAGYATDPNYAAKLIDIIGRMVRGN